MALIISLIIFLSAVIIHEFAHAFIAYKLGDSTAQRRGRLTLNPLAHIDPFGTILFPLLLILMQSPVLFGWAKPVPINYSRLKNPKQDMIWVGLAGPMANLLLALIVSFLFKIGLKASPAISAFLGYVMLFNVVLAVFNMIPIPPLDGSRVLMGLLPLPLAIRFSMLEPYGFLLIIALLYLGLFDRIVLPITTLILHFLMNL